MPELRQNLATKEWVVIANERARRPNAYVESQQRPLTTDHKLYVPTCPFCPGNEEHDLEIERFPDETGWQTRVVGNKYPALSQQGDLVRTFDGVHRLISGVGYHEIVVEHPLHNTTLALMSAGEILTVLETIQRRGRAIAADSRIEQIIYFKNHGERAGASLHHPHNQIIALPVVPDHLRHRIEEARRYYDDTGTCVYCTMIQDELRRDERILYANQHFVAFVLYAASSPFHSWIVPRRHSSSFLNATLEELVDLSLVLRDVLLRLYLGLRDPAYNLIIRSAPFRERENEYLHWYLALVPRLSHTAGFELGSGMYINPSLPEECAAFLRELPISDDQIH